MDFNVASKQSITELALLSAWCLAIDGSNDIPVFVAGPLQERLISRSR